MTGPVPCQFTSSNRAGQPDPYWSQGYLLAGPVLVAALPGVDDTTTPPTVDPAPVTDNPASATVDCAINRYYGYPYASDATASGAVVVDLPPTPVSFYQDPSYPASLCTTWTLYDRYGSSVKLYYDAASGEFSTDASTAVCPTIDDPLAAIPDGPVVVTLTVTPPLTVTGQRVTVDATATTTAGWVEIFDDDTGTPVQVCPATALRCSIDDFRVAAGTRNYVAYAMPSFSTVEPSPSENRPSARATATWLDPAAPPLPQSDETYSSRCDGGLALADATVEGLRVKAYLLQPAPTETDACVRVGDVANGTGVGGELVVMSALPGGGVTGVAVPSTDTQSGQCTTTAGNAVPGSHPVATATVAGTPVLVDTYASGSAVWLCVEVGTTLRSRIVVPISVPSVNLSPMPGAQFYPDPDTP